MNDKEICARCAHYRTKGGGAGQCWFGPPTPILIGMKDGHPLITSARAPVPGNTAACGQFHQKLIIEPGAFSNLPPMPNG